MDASDTGIGAVLEKQYGHVIAYTSRALSSSERNNSIIQKECLAVVHSLKLENFPPSLTILPYSGCLLRKSKVYLPGGHLPCKNMIS